MYSEYFQALFKQSIVRLSKRTNLDFLSRDQYNDNEKPDVPERNEKTPSENDECGKITAKPR